MRLLLVEDDIDLQQFLQQQLLEQTCPGSAPPLPESFAERHSKEAAALDDADAFCSKAEYLELFEQQWAAGIRVLDGLSEEDFEKPAPEAFHDYAKTVGDVITMPAVHLLMHVGQWAVVRRNLGRGPLY